MGFVHRRRRGAELFLLILALAVGIGAYAAVGIGVEGEVPADILAYGGWLAGLVVAAHIVVRMVAPYADPVLLPCVAALNGLGLAVIHRLDLAYEAIAGQARGLRDQAAHLDDARRAAVRRSPWCSSATTGCCTRFTYTCGAARDRAAAAADGPGPRHEINGARIWIGVGPFSFQPGELAKVLLVIAFAGYLVLHRDALALAGRRVLFIDLPRGRDLGPILVMWLISLGILVFQRDLGSSLLFFGLFLVMLYVATERPGWLVVGGLLFFGGAALSYPLVRPRPEPGQHLARPDALLRRDARQRPDRRVAVRHGVGRPDRPRLRRAAAPSGSRSRSRTSSSARSVRSSASPGSSR